MAPDCASGPHLRLAQLGSASLFGLLLILAACAPNAVDPPAVISYDATPRPIPSETLRPTFTRIRVTRVAGAARTATPLPSSSPSPKPATVAPAESPPSDPVHVPSDQDPEANPNAPAADSGAGSPDSDPASNAPDPVEATPTLNPTPTGTIAANPGPDVGTATDTSPTAAVDTPKPTPTPRPSTPTMAPRATATRAASPTRTPTPSSYPGQVTEDQGLFVTSRTSGTEYYYAKDDTGWHRIHPENRVWFMSAADLLRAFPNRALHSPTPTRTPTRAP